MLFACLQQEYTIRARLLAQARTNVEGTYLLWQARHVCRRVQRWEWV